ncbi:uncharacterized protein CLUP02_13577 [Colletotrichum lupini]|uniref:Uncharacterized protein n=1 Tax=Colletotrichum lupini TaxID=145971 RepID=A0A9Q8WMG6_9PEZI|nr:uncharacterized protein CLUP02_13577 [Colletotrichum lupini]UQC88055.1 hypothetical protein CLUP02_13577 [Colletotrichum lupini]
MGQKIANKQTLVAVMQRPSKDWDARRTPLDARLLRVNTDACLARQTIRTTARICGSSDSNCLHPSMAIDNLFAEKWRPPHGTTVHYRPELQAIVTPPLALLYSPHCRAMIKLWPLTDNYEQRVLPYIDHSIALVLAGLRHQMHPALAQGKDSPIRQIGTRQDRRCLEFSQCVVRGGSASHTGPLVFLSLFFPPRLGQMQNQSVGSLVPGVKGREASSPLPAHLTPTSASDITTDPGMFWYAAPNRSGKVVEPSQQRPITQLGPRHSPSIVSVQHDHAGKNRESNFDC